KTKTKIHRCCFSLTLWFLRGAQDPIPSRTRPSNSSAPMVLSLKTWESRSLQGLPKTVASLNDLDFKKPRHNAGAFCVYGSDFQHKGRALWITRISKLIAPVVSGFAAPRCSSIAGMVLGTTSAPALHAITSITQDLAAASTTGPRVSAPGGWQAPLRRD